MSAENPFAGATAAAGAAKKDVSDIRAILKAADSKDLEKKSRERIEELAKRSEAELLAFGTPNPVARETPTGNISGGG